MTRIVRVPFLLAWPPKRYAAQVLIPNVIFARRGVPLTERLVAHELSHVDDLKRLGLIRYWLQYLTLLVVKGYRKHPMEAQAEWAGMHATYRQRARDLLKDES